MSVKSQALRALVLERLAVAADEIFALFERTFAQYEEEVLRSKLLQEPQVALYKGDIQTVTVGVDVHCEPPEPTKAKSRQANPPVAQYPCLTLKTEEHDPAESKHQNRPGEQCDGEEPSCSSALYANRQPRSYSDVEDSVDWELMDERTHGYGDAGFAEYAADCADEPRRAAPFRAADALAKRPQRHAESRRISCPICSKVLSSKSTFKQHLITHSKQKPFTCSVCKHRFAQKRHFDEHMRIHTGEKPLSCAKCDMKFRQQYSLMRHVLSKHSADKPFRCSVCQKGFVEKWHYDVHMRKHIS